MTRYITANGEEVEIVEETRNGDQYYVATGVPIVKPMELATGYVPREWVAASTEMENTHGCTGWDGTTPTVNHPRNHSEFSWHDPERPEDDIVLAANEDVQETLGVGTVENDRFDGEYVRADIAINADEAREMGGEAADIVDDIEAGRGLEVSSQYLHAELPPGEYDGEHRTNAKAIAAPDSVALVPNGRGVCSVEDGCGIAPGVAANVADYPDVGAISAGSDDPVSPQTGQGEGQRTMDNGSQMAGVRQLFSGLASLVGSAAGPKDPAANSTETTGAATEGESSESPVDDDTDHEMNGTANTTFEGQSVAEIMGVVGGTIEPQVDELMAEVRENLEDEYDGDDVEEIMGAIGGTLTAHVDSAVDEMSDQLRWEDDEPESNSDTYHTANMDRDDLIEEITANSNIKRDSLEGMGDTCLETTHKNIVGNADGGDDDDPEDGQDDDPTADDADDVDDTGGGTIGDMTPQELGETLREQGFVTEDAIGDQVEATANELEREERAKNIVANSAEYDSEDVDWIADLPEKELERKERGATQTGGAPATSGTGAFGATGNAGGDGDVDTDDMPDLEVN
ncbi:DUF2213 domain-containing protein [Natronorubrum sp. JWXQ-INN-674]|uniref:DUF2213 domain-containing protein n=1 Tax=Natronorubrum halalkaliphilum TaxID=2691917 RepID=A0A6B0VKL6_9EURY|nr:DUF2213 domain-containing protein [Natronorubrum halalkaliphilum]MXV62068.1 DUF2213 domain-containing protein [Natronorubrum halalkaliphilum]